MVKPKTKKMFIKKEAPAIRLRKINKKDSTSSLGPSTPPAASVDPYHHFGEGYFSPNIPVLNNPSDFRPPNLRYIDFYCPYCGHYNRGRSDFSGSLINCSCCGNGITVPFPPTRPIPRIMVSSPPMAVPPVPPPSATQPSAVSPPPNTNGVSPARVPSPPVLNMAAASRIKFYCVFCGQKLSALPEMIGESSLCPSCSRAVKVPPPPEEDKKE